MATQYEDQVAERLKELKSITESQVRAGGKLVESMKKQMDMNKAANRARLTEMQVATRNQKQYNEYLSKFLDKMKGSGKSFEDLTQTVALLSSGMEHLVQATDDYDKVLEKELPEAVKRSIANGMLQGFNKLNNFEDVLKFKEFAQASQKFSAELERTGGQVDIKVRKAFTSLVKMMNEAGVSVQTAFGPQNAGNIQKMYDDIINGTRLYNQNNNSFAQHLRHDVLPVIGNLREQTTKLSVAMAEAAREVYKNREKEAEAQASSWKYLLGKSMAKHGGGIGGFFGGRMMNGGGGGSLASAAGGAGRAAAFEMIVKGTKYGVVHAVKELIEMAETGMKTGVQPFAKEAYQLGISGAEYQKVMKENMQAIRSTTNGYDDINKMMIQGSNNFRYLAGNDGKLAAKMNLESIDLIKSFGGVGHSMKDLQQPVDDYSHSLAFMRNTTNKTAEQIIQMDKAVIDDADFRRSIVGLGDKERKAMLQSIHNRVAEYTAMGVSTEKAYELAKTMEKQNDIMTPAKARLRATAYMRMMAGHLGFNGQFQQQLGMLLNKKGTIGLGDTEQKQLKSMLDQVADREAQKRGQMKNNPGAALQEGELLRRMQEGIGGWGDLKTLYEGSLDATNTKSKATQPGATKQDQKGPDGWIMKVGTGLSDIKFELNAVKQNVVGALQSPTVILGGILGILTLWNAGKIVGGIGKGLLSGGKGIMAGAGAAGSWLGKAGGFAKSVPWSKIGKAGLPSLALAAGGIASDHFLGKDSMTSKVLNSHTLRLASLGAFAGPFAPEAALALGAGGAAWDALDYFRKPSGAPQTPAQQAAAAYGDPDSDQSKQLQQSLDKLIDLMQQNNVYTKKSADAQTDLTQSYKVAEKDKLDAAKKNQMDVRKQQIAGARPASGAA